MSKQRIEKIIAHNTSYTRSQILKMIRKGNIQVNGIKIHKSILIESQKDFVLINDQPLKISKYHYYLFNKPAGYLSANSDKNDLTIFDLINLKPTQYFCVGRLDKDSEGLMIITDDGGWANWVLKPKNHIPKTYYVEVDKEFNDTIKRHSGDIKIQGYIVNKYKFKFITKNTCELTIYEGKYHQVKQMLNYFGYTVTYLKRISFGSVTLPDDLAKGQIREVDFSTISSFKKS
ncbi:rRNA pseudouridine synthase [Mycoplasmopsis phocirhinis]|uniref:Pseudouridine synthase n=1 Tax=Mycoplasmopsis phocirhinis TaxID=142650 RepID=A0A4P6MT00_9BACT|nr:pseudouridine synthase [Mycoplasmopsis phocirhinis]QBF34427.1 rRNA pseudouridine synthase [Mycoplasmopsis phocirhinis]